MSGYHSVGYRRQADFVPTHSVTLLRGKFSTYCFVSATAPRSMK
jgi:hypothetical protein